MLLLFGILSKKIGNLDDTLPRNQRQKILRTQNTKTIDIMLKQKKHKGNQMEALMGNPEYLVIVAVLVVVGIYFIKGEKGNTTRRDGTSFTRAEMFTPAEKKLTRAIIEAVDGVYFVSAKVKMSFVVTPRLTLGNQRKSVLLRQLQDQHFEIVLCNKELEPVVVIELNNPKEGEISREARDRIIGKVCGAAKLPLVWIQVQDTYTTEGIREQIKNALI